MRSTCNPMFPTDYALQSQILKRKVKNTLHVISMMLWKLGQYGRRYKLLLTLWVSVDMELDQVVHPAVAKLFCELKCKLRNIYPLDSDSSNGMLSALSAN